VVEGLGEVEVAAVAGRGAEARQAAVRLYLDGYERIEAYYGPGGVHEAAPLAALIAGAERRFHELLQSGDDPERVSALVAALRADLSRILVVARDAGVPLRPDAAGLAGTARFTATGRPARDFSPELRVVVEELDAALAAFRAGDRRGALARVEHAYLEGFEPLESRLPGASVAAIERLIHLGLRPQLAQGAPAAEIEQSFAALRGELEAADSAVADGMPFWLAAGNAFAILVREGLEAVLLVGALLAYLLATGADRRHVRQIWAGVGLGVLASIATWLLARTLIPLGGAGRELVEGITGLLAVGVLLYVSHWLFRKAYLDDWKHYLKDRLGRAVSSGSGWAMAGLAFAAVYREGFETVLFYQALLFSAGTGAVLAGFLPGAILITVLGVVIIRSGVRLPLRLVFGATNLMLLYLAFVFLGKSIYNLQEAGLFAPHPLAWIPDSPWLVQLLGLHPVLETVTAQACFLATLAAAFLFLKRRIERNRDRGGRYAPAAAG